MNSSLHQEILAYYEQAPENEVNRLERHQLEFDISWRYFQDYLPPQGRILEIGAATGRYTLPLAKQGYQIKALDISEKLLDYNQKQVKEAGLEKQVEWDIANALNLKDFYAQDFDIVLMMGPLYHLLESSERNQAIQEGNRCLKKEGVFCSSWISRWGIFADLIKKMPQWIENGEMTQTYLSLGKDLEVTPGNFQGYFATLAEIPEIHESNGFKTLVLAATEPCIGSDDQSYNQLQGIQRKKWLDLFYQLSREASILATSRHLLYIGKKAKPQSS